MQVVGQLGVQKTRRTILDHALKVATKEGLEARALDGSRLFRLSEGMTPLLIDAWGRLLCVRGAELVAVA